MGLFCMNSEKVKTVQGSLEAALSNLEMYVPYCKEGLYTDSIGQNPPNYLVTNFAISLIKEALEIIEQDGPVKDLGKENRHNW